MVQPYFYEATRILFVHKENKNNDFIQQFLLLPVSLRCAFMRLYDACVWCLLLLSILLFSLYFWSDKCSLGEHKRLLSKTIGMIIDMSWEFQSCGVSGFLTSTAFLPQIFGSRACVRWRALWLPGKEGQVNTQRGQEVLQTDHLSAGLLSQSLYMVRVLDCVKISVCFIGNQNP